MKFKRQLKNEVSVNLTPLIDVVFLLLIFFMVSTTFTKESHLTVTLPEAESEVSESVNEQLEILISVDGKFSVNSRALINSKIGTLMSALETESGGDHSLPVVITADAETPHRAVVRAMDAAGQLGFVHLNITTRQPSAE